MTKTVQGRRITLANGEIDNGLKLLRALFVENECGVEQITTGGVTSLHSFPQCPRMEYLQDLVGQWQTTRMTYGQHIPDVHLKTLFLKMVPEQIATDIRKRPELDTLQLCIAYVLGEIGRYKDTRLAKIHAQRVHKALSNGN